MKANEQIEFTNCVITNPESREDTNIYVEQDIFATDKKNPVLSIDLKGTCVYPGFINSHDHLLGTYLPKVGNGPYLNWKPWDEDLKNSALYAERGKIPNDDLYLLSMYRQILSGVTTVSDHIPHVVNEPFIKNSYVRIIEKYAMAHECSSYDLNWGDGLEAEIAKAKKENIPFITHIEEGWDKEAMEGVPALDKKNGLNEHAVLIHCIACSPSDIKLISQKKANFVWCPSSNLFMFDKTADIKTFLKENVNVALGTDSPMSGGINLLDEIKIAKKAYKKIYDSDLPDEVLFKMFTINAAKAFKMDKIAGSIEPGKLADLVVMRKQNNDPLTNILKSNISDILLVLRGGVPVYGAAEYKDLFKAFENTFEQVSIDGQKKLLIGEPKKLQDKINKAVKFNKEFDFFPIA